MVIIITAFSEVERHPIGHFCLFIGYPVITVCATGYSPRAFHKPCPVFLWLIACKEICLAVIIVPAHYAYGMIYSTIFCSFRIVIAFVIKGHIQVVCIIAHHYSAKLFYLVFNGVSTACDSGSVIKLIFANALFLLRYDSGFRSVGHERLIFIIAKSSMSRHCKGRIHPRSAAIPY